MTFCDSSGDRNAGGRLFLPADGIADWQWTDISTRGTPHASSAVRACLGLCLYRRRPALFSHERRGLSSSLPAIVTIIIIIIIITDSRHRHGSSAAESDTQTLETVLLQCALICLPVSLIAKA